MVKLNWGLSLCSQFLAAWQKKLKEPADQLKYYGSKYAWMTAKVLELFSHEISFNTGRTGKFSDWKRFHDWKLGNQAHYSHPIKPAPPCPSLPLHPQHGHAHAYKCTPHATHAPCFLYTSGSCFRPAVQYLIQSYAVGLLFGWATLRSHITDLTDGHLLQ